MRKRISVRVILMMALGLAFCWGNGCNPMFEQSVGLSSFTPTAPGQSDFILVRFLTAANMPPGTGITYSAISPHNEIICAVIRNSWVLLVSFTWDICYACVDQKFIAVMEVV